MRSPGLLERLGIEISKPLHGNAKALRPLKVIAIQPSEIATPREDLSTAISRVAETTIPAVVQIQVTSGEKSRIRSCPLKKILISPLFPSAQEDAQEVQRGV